MTASPSSKSIHVPAVPVHAQEQAEQEPENEEKARKINSDSCSRKSACSEENEKSREQENLDLEPALLFREEDPTDDLADSSYADTENESEDIPF